MFYAHLKWQMKSQCAQQIIHLFMIKTRISNFNFKTRQTIIIISMYFGKYAFTVKYTVSA